MSIGIEGHESLLLFVASSMLGIIFAVSIKCMNHFGKSSIILILLSTTSVLFSPGVGLDPASHYINIIKQYINIIEHNIH